MAYTQYPVLSAIEFIAQGTTAGAIMSIAAGRGYIEAVAREVALMTGQSLKWPGQATDEREASRRYSSKKNRKQAGRAGR